MTEPRLRHVQCLNPKGLHRMAYWEWLPQPDAPAPAAGSADVVVCVHGLTRQGRDFDTLARELSRTHRVICPDVVGRGQSDWLPDPAGYQVPTYVADMVTLLARLDAPSITWVGTSMGGLIGMVLTSLRSTPIKRLVLNDVGPTLQPAAIVRIAEYVGRPLSFATVEEAADYLETISTGFGPHSRDAWLALTRPQLKAAADGRWQSHYDPAIAQALRSTTTQIAAAGEALLWHCYDQIQAPTLVLRGAESDLLTSETARGMSQRGPKAHVVEIDGVGHAPTLVDPEQVRHVADFVRAGA